MLISRFRACGMMAKSLAYALIVVLLTLIVSGGGLVRNLREGDPFSLSLGAIDPEGDFLTYFARNLPAGAVLDGTTHNFEWTPGFNAAGTYEGVTLGVTDGVSTVTRAFTLFVSPVNQPPALTPVANRTVREGDPIRIELQAKDPEGDPISYSSSLLPSGAFLDPNTGVFEWTPGFTQAGTYAVPFVASDGHSSTQVTTTFTVLNANGAPVFDELGPYEFLENQPISFQTFALDPDNPEFVLQNRLADGTLTQIDGTAPTVTYTAADLPGGAVSSARVRSNEPGCP